MNRYIVVVCDRQGKVKSFDFLASNDEGATARAKAAGFHQYRGFENFAIVGMTTLARDASDEAVEAVVTDIVNRVNAGAEA